jgi:hypothetical protein
MRKNVFLGIPAGDGRVPAHLIFSIFNATQKYNVDYNAICSSALTGSFNYLWTMAINKKADYFVMLHSDIEPERDFIEVLITELERLDADVVSAVSPLKSVHGITSTGLGDPNDIWAPTKRYSLKEIFELPETFSNEDTGRPDKILVVNTGCFIVNMKKPWVTQVCFDVHNKIYVENGEYKSRFYPEDWLFSRDVQRLGGKVYATRKVSLSHIGNHYFTNSSVWGTEESDPDYVD